LLFECASPLKRKADQPTNQREGEADDSDRDLSEAQFAGPAEVTLKEAEGFSLNVV